MMSSHDEDGWWLADVVLVISDVVSTKNIGYLIQPKTGNDDGGEGRGGGLQLWSGLSENGKKQLG